MRISGSLRSMARGLACLLAVTTTLVCARSQDGWAMLVPVEGAAPVTQRAADVKLVQTALESKAVKERLKGFGLSDAEVQSRMQSLSDEEVHQLAVQIEALGPGGDGGVVVALLVVAVLVLLIVFLVKRV